jgi:hypothetical protein
MLRAKLQLQPENRSRVADWRALTKLRACSTNAVVAGSASLRSNTAFIV